MAENIENQKAIPSFTGHSFLKEDHNRVRLTIVIIILLIIGSSIYVVSNYIIVMNLPPPKPKPMIITDKNMSEEQKVALLAKLNENSVPKLNQKQTAETLNKISTSSASTTGLTKEQALDLLNKLNKK